MSFIEGLTLVGFGATIFALIVGIFSVWNGRMTRREIIKAITETRGDFYQTQKEISQTQKEMKDILARITELIASIPQKTVSLMKESEIKV